MILPSRASCSRRTLDIGGLVGFLKLVSSARGEIRTGASSEMKIGDSLIMVSDGDGVREARRAFLYVYVENTDETPSICHTATGRPPLDNIWQIGTHGGGAFA